MTSSLGTLKTYQGEPALDSLRPKHFVIIFRLAYAFTFPLVSNLANRSHPKCRCEFNRQRLLWVPYYVIGTLPYHDEIQQVKRKKTRSKAGQVWCGVNALYKVICTIVSSAGMANTATATPCVTF